MSRSKSRGCGGGRKGSQKRNRLKKALIASGRIHPSMYPKKVDKKDLKSNKYHQKINPLNMPDNPEYILPDAYANFYLRAIKKDIDIFSNLTSKQKEFDYKTPRIIESIGENCSRYERLMHRHLPFKQNKEKYKSSYQSLLNKAENLDIEIIISPEKGSYRHEKIRS